jgi:hypothetical protein
MPAQRLSRSTHPAVRAGGNATVGDRFAVPRSRRDRLITVAAILTLRGVAEPRRIRLGEHRLLCRGGLFFFIPLAFVAAELATGWPRAGGMYAWVKQGWGSQTGFLAVWFDWIENVVWFPTVLSFVAATLAYMFDPSLAENKLYLVVVMLVVFWA